MPTDLGENESGIFLRKGLDRFLGDLPVVPVCRSGASRLRLRAKQISSQTSVGWAKRQRAHHLEARSMTDGGHGANAPLPILRATTRYERFRRMTVFAGFASFRTEHNGSRLGSDQGSIESGSHEIATCCCGAPLALSHF